MLQKKISLIILIIYFFSARTFLAGELFQRPSPLESIPLQDREFFLNHFRTLLRSECGFTLIGAKPLSSIDFADYELVIDTQGNQKFLRYLQLLFENSPRFTLRTRYLDGELCGEFLIDRAAFRKLQEDPDADIFFETIRIGKLFGFGEENSFFYQRRSALGKFLCKIPFIWLVPLTPKYLTTQIYQSILFQQNAIQIPYKKIECPEVIPPFTSLEEEWCWIVENENPVPDWDVPPMWIRHPRFISKKGPESDVLFKHYNDAANQLGKILSDENWFEYILKLIRDDKQQQVCESL